MAEYSHIGKMLIVFGVLLVGIGLMVYFGKTFSWFGRLPGDIYIKKENVSFYLPITTCILVSIVLTFLFQIFFRK
jgi:hypothetical protein